MVILLIFMFFLSLLLALLVTPLAKRVSDKFGILDYPDYRKIHKGNIPLLGGASIFISVLISSLIYLFFLSELSPGSHGSPSVFVSIFAGAVLMLTLGLWDDARRMRASTKLFIQITIAALVYALGFRIESLRFFDGIYFSLGYLGLPFTVLWIVGITNAVNLVDGMDGLASGLSLIAFAFISLVAFLFGNYAVGFLSFAFCGALMGFTRYNFHPASIFMGDSGSLFLGFILSVFSVQAMRNGHLQFSILVPVFLLAIPILDTSLAIARRFVRFYVRNENGRSIVETVKKILYPDSRHIHHQLLAKGISQRRASLMLYGIAVLGGCVAVAFNYLTDGLVIILLTVLLIAILKFIDYLDYEEFRFEKRVAVTAQDRE